MKKIFVFLFVLFAFFSVYGEDNSFSYPGKLGYIETGYMPSSYLQIGLMDTHVAYPKYVELRLNPMLFILPRFTKLNGPVLSFTAKAGYSFGAFYLAAGYTYYSYNSEDELVKSLNEDAQKEGDETKINSLNLNFKGYKIFGSLSYRKKGSFWGAHLNIGSFKAETDDPINNISVGADFDVFSWIDAFFEFSYLMGVDTDVSETTKEVYYNTAATSYVIGAGVILNPFSSFFVKIGVLYPGIEVVTDKDKDEKVSIPVIPVVDIFYRF